MKIVAIIQARMGSSRLPGKMMMDICGKPVIQHVWERVKPSKLIDEIWLATTADPADDELERWAKKNNVLCHRGSRDDVLDRFYQTAQKARADVLVRITGDCPLHDYREIDKAISYFNSGVNFDYVTNSNPPTYPDGLDTEVFSIHALERAWKGARLNSEREHVTPYIYKHPELFRLGNISNNVDLSAHRWTLDTAEDLEFIRRVAGACGNNNYCGLSEILDILEKHPDWPQINARRQRNEGYVKSLREDKAV